MRIHFLTALGFSLVVRFCRWSFGLRRGYVNLFSACNRLSFLGMLGSGPEAIDHGWAGRGISILYTSTGNNYLLLLLFNPPPPDTVSSTVRASLAGPAW